MSDTTATSSNQRPIETAAFEEDKARPVPGDTLGGELDAHDQLLLDIDGYEGPIDVLLEMSRKQKVDLTHISILQLVRQYLGFIDRARELRLDLAAEYLVMAAWLAYLKSKLLLPAIEEENEEPGGDEMAAALTYQLKRLQTMRDAADKLSEHPQMGQDFFPRGFGADGLTHHIETSYQASLYDLLRAYGAIRRRGEAGQDYQPVEFNLVSIDEAMSRLKEMLGNLPGLDNVMDDTASAWATLESFLPEKGGAKEGPEDRLLSKSALASTLLASLELAKQGYADIRQDQAFRPIYLRRSSALAQASSELQDRAEA